MTLSNEQKQLVAEWVNSGIELKDLQNKIREEFDISLTYMDVRFLVDDLDLSLQDKPEPETSEPQAPADILQDDSASAGGVSMEVDKLTVPNAIISGTVTFSDGETAKWLIDNTGRPGLVPDTQGYRPTPEDIQEFQKLLTEALQKQGFA